MSAGTRLEKRVARTGPRNILERRRQKCSWPSILLKTTSSSFESAGFQFCSVGKGSNLTHQFCHGTFALGRNRCCIVQERSLFVSSFTSTAERKNKMRDQQVGPKCWCHKPHWEKLGRAYFVQVPCSTESKTVTTCCPESIVCGKQMQVFRCRACQGIEEREVTSGVEFCLNCRRQVARRA